MRSFTKLGAAVVTTLALATPALTTVAQAAPGHRASVAGTAVTAVGQADKRAKAPIRLKRSSKGVQPGIAEMKITAFVNGGGKVKFTVKATGFKTSKKVKIKNGRAVYKVPPLGTGNYKVQASYQGRKGKTKFKVYNSALSVNSTSFTFSASAEPTTYAPLFGTVLFKDKPATDGYVDIYQNGNIKGGQNSPYFLGFATINADGTFNPGTGFGSKITKGYGLAGGNLPTFGPGTYTFQAYYTDGPEYKDYISSNLITVTVTP